jgi:hypothetical protein
MITKLQELVRRAETWPKAAQEEAIASLEAIEQDYLEMSELSSDDIAALEESAEDVRLGRFATDAEVQEVFSRRQRR